MPHASDEAAERAEAAIGEWLEIEPKDLCYVVIGFSTSQHIASKAFGFRPEIILKANSCDPQQIIDVLSGAAAKMANGDATYMPTGRRIMSDQQWKPLAVSSREALSQLGYTVGVCCLPDELDPCGGSFAEHTVAHLAALMAVADHHLAHLGAPAEMIDDIYRRTAVAVDCSEIQTNQACKRSLST